jgi:ATP/maltotriose-dependent transcriptional regulator MalT
VSPPLVGREKELQVLEELLVQTRAGPSRFAVVTGEAGIGKSCVLGELVRRAAASGWLVLEGRATELERVYPFGLFVDALDGYLAALDDRAKARLTAEELGDLAAIFPTMRALRPQAALPATAAERFRAHHAARELIERIAARQPLLLALDDAHWSDGASTELLVHLLSRAPKAAVLIAMTMRTGQAPPALEAAVDEAVRAGCCRQAPLGPLTLRDARIIVPDARAETLYRESGGNPFFLLQLARAAPRAMPAGIAAAIGAELDALSEHSRVLARAAAIVGDPFDLDVALAVSRLAEPGGLAALDELIARDVLRAEVAPRLFRFRHPLVRKAVYEACPPGLRLVAHERAAELLQARGASPTERAHHVAQSARHGDLIAIEVLRAAALDAAQRAPSSAAAWLAAALRILPRSTPDAERASLLRALADATAATGRLEESRSALLEALELDSPDRASLISACARIELLLGRFEEAQVRLESALREVSPPASLTAGRLMMDLALNAFYAGDYERMREWGRRAGELARELDEDPLAAASLACLAFAGSATGPVGDAQGHCSQAATLIDAMGDAQLRDWLDALTHLCGAEYCLDRFEDAIRHASRGIALGRTAGRGDLFPGLAQTLAGALFSTGRLREAGALIADMADAARLTDNAVGLAWSLVNGAYVSLVSGDVEASLRESQEALARTAAMEHGVVSAWAGCIHGAALVEASEADRAAELIVAAGGGDGLPLIPGAFRANFLEILTRARLGAGDLAGARRSADFALHRAQSFGLALASAVAARAAAAVDLASGEALRAAHLAAASAERADGVGARLEAALSRALAGRAFVAAGEPERAIALLEHAVRAFEACGAERYRKEAERDLRRLGRGSYRRSAAAARDGDGIASLTGRELEVARLVVDRRTNPQIAAELFLSVKTVETHLRNIFRKLDVSSRVELARFVERCDTAGSG